MIDVGQFLEAVSGYGEAKQTKSASRIARLGVVDVGYVSGKPRVTLDGDASMSTSGFAFLSSYSPDPGDRVLLIPVGNSYVIVGSIATA